MNSKVVFRICLITSVILLTVSFLLPPTGVIDPSVLKAVSELFAFAALWRLPDAIKEGTNARWTKGDTSIEISRTQNGNNK